MPASTKNGITPPISMPVSALATEPISKVLRSAVANAQQKADSAGNFLDTDELYVREAYVNEGPRLRRFRAAAMGRAAPRIKRTSQVTIVVDRKE